jgi:hypothetical protein
MTDIKTLLAKGNLTGEEVGRIFLRDFARFMGAIQAEQTPPKDKFTDAEKQTMVNRLTEPYEIRQYNTFIGIIQFLQKTSIIYSEQYRQLKYLLVALLREIDQAKLIEVVRLLLADAPLILTEAQYKSLKKEDLEAKLAKKTSVGGIILTATEYYIKQYLLEPQGLAKGKTDKESKDIAQKEAYAVVKELRINQNLKAEDIDELQRQKPYGLLFEAYKKQPLTNPEFKNNFWQEGANGHYETPDGKRGDKLPKEEWSEEIYKWHAKEAETGEDYIKWVNDSREAPPDATKHDILEYLGYYLNIGEETKAKDLETFKNDYPDIYEAILTEIKGIEGLTLPENYTDPAISYKTLYELDLPYYRQFFRFNPKDGEAFIASFLSIIPEEELKHWDKWKRERYLDKDGNYKYQLSDHERKELTEVLPSTIERVKQHLKQLFAVQEIYRILGEELGEDCITELATDKNYIFKETDTDNDIGKERRKLGIPPTGFLYEFIGVINENLEDFGSMLRKTSLVIDQATIKEIHEAVSTLPLIKIKDLRPKKEAVAEVKELTKDLSYYGAKGLSLYDILTETI